MGRSRAAGLLRGIAGEAEIVTIRAKAEEAGAEAPAWGHIEGGVSSPSLAKYFPEKERIAIAEAMGNGKNDLILFQVGKAPRPCA